MTATIVDMLDVASLETGMHRLLVALVHNGLGRPLYLPALVAKGRREGPTVGITAAVHGNELNGIPVIHRLMRQLEPSKLRGTVVAMPAVNTSGIHRFEREFQDGTDLNHIMPGRADGNAAQVYAYRFIDRIVSKFDVLLDLHTASFGRVNSLYIRADMTDPKAAAMAYRQRPQIIVHNPPSDGTLRGAATEMGIPAITIEIGDPQRFQARLIKRTCIGLRAVLADLGMVSRRPVAPSAPPVVCARSYWLYTDHGGLLDVRPELTASVTKGDVIAELHDIFGDLQATYHADNDGVVIGHSVNPVACTGARILHLGIRATGTSNFVMPSPAVVPE